MSFDVTLILSDGTETVIPCQGDQYILDAAEEEGIKLPYSCKVGSCSSCVGKVIEGEVDNSEQSYLNKNQLNDGHTLLCVAYPLSDCKILTEIGEIF